MKQKKLNKNFKSNQIKRIFVMKINLLLLNFLDNQLPKVESINHQHMYVSPRSSVRIAVYLMSGVFLTMEVERNATAQQTLAVVQSENELGLSRTPPINGQPVFAMWLCSSQLEVQLRPNHRPLELAAKWPGLVKKYGSQDGPKDEEPLLYFRRNVFLTRREEEQIKDPKTLELLYAEARHNVLEGNRISVYFLGLKGVKHCNRLKNHRFFCDFF